jgi:hypothetical protein
LIPVRTIEMATRCSLIRSKVGIIALVFSMVCVIKLANKRHANQIINKLGTDLRREILAVNTGFIHV